MMQSGESHEIPQRQLVCLLEDFELRNNYNEQLEQYSLQYPIGAYEISKLSLSEVIQMYRHISNSFYLKNPRRDHVRNLWLENQLRIFVYVLTCYSIVQGKQLQKFEEEDFRFLGLIFNNRSPQSIQFQVRQFHSIQNCKPWPKDQHDLLKDLINEQHPKQSESNYCWGKIAQRLYVQSHRKFFRSARQCRQRWVNHMDPKKVKGKPWTPKEDIILLGILKYYGRKWSWVTKFLRGQRNDHDAKNRFRQLQIARKGKSRLQLSVKQTIDRSLLICKSKYEKYDRIMKKLRELKTEDFTLSRKAMSARLQKFQAELQSESSGEDKDVLKKQECSLQEVDGQEELEREIGYGESAEMWPCEVKVEQLQIEEESPQRPRIGANLNKIKGKSSTKRE